MLKINSTLQSSIPARLMGGSFFASQINNWVTNGRLNARFNGSPTAIPVGRRSEYAYAPSVKGYDITALIRATSQITSASAQGLGDVASTINGVASITTAELTGLRYGEAVLIGSATVLGNMRGDANLNSVIRIGFNPSADDIAGNLLDAQLIETGLTVRDALRLITASLAGKVSGAAGTTITFKSAVADSKDRIVATVDGDGNRTAITYDLSD